MSYITGSVFLIFIFFYYYLLGNFTIDLVATKYSKLNSFKILTGFIICYFISFIIGVPCQIFKVSWKVFFYLMLLTNLLIFIYTYKYKFNKVCDFFEFLHAVINKKVIITWIKNNWICIIFVLVFVSLSLTNVMVLDQLNYDDPFYISKIVNSIGTTALQNEDYYNGMLVNQGNIDLGRILNTYEISYGFWADLFHIEVPIFCRYVMNIHNYVIFIIVIKNLASLFLNENKAQYVLLLFFVLLIPSGYLMEGNENYHIRSFDLWQFQTAMWYGGSIVRTMTLPIIFLYAVPLLDKIKIKSFILIIIVAITMVSFSSIALPMLIILFFIFYILKFSINIKNGIISKNYRKIYFNIFGLVLIVGLLLITKKLDHTFLLDIKTIDTWRDTIYPYELYYVSNDIFFKYSVIILLVSFFLLISSKLYVFPIFVALLILFVPTGYFSELLCLTSVNFFFVIIRFFSAIQFMIIFLLSLIITKIFIRFKKNVINNLISLGIIIGVGCFIIINYNNIIMCDFLGSGISQKGYDADELVKNETLVLDIYSDVGNYFDTLPYGNYTLLAPAEKNIDNHKILYSGFVMGSNRIQIVYRIADTEMNKNYDVINSYLNNQISYVDAKGALEYFNNDYILTFSRKQAVELEENGSEIVYKKGDYYLLKLDN